MRRSAIGRSERAALQLLAICPGMPADAVASLLGMRHTRSAAQLLDRLRKRGLGTYQSVRLGPIISSRPVRLWSLTAAGDALVSSADWLHASTPAQTPYARPLHRPRLPRNCDLPMLVAAYRLLGEFASGLPSRVRITQWEHPWVRTWPVTGDDRHRHVRLPAAAVLETSGNGCFSVLLVPDYGTLPLGSYRLAVRGLHALRNAKCDRTTEPLLVVGVVTRQNQHARATAWECLLDSVARQTSSSPLAARLLTREQLSGGLAGSFGPARRATQLDELFALIARQPLLTRPQLQTLLDTSRSRVGRLIEQLLERGWIRSLHVELDAPAATADPWAPCARRLNLLELTEAGRRQAARELLLPAGHLRRRHGLLRGDRFRGALLRHLQHTLGANAFFVELATSAKRLRDRNMDVRLIEWRSAAACARGRFRPDGYGCFGSGSGRFGFFLEYDRGTERASQYATKLATYFRYCASGAYLRDFDTFPSLLVVCTTDAAEARIAHQIYLTEQRHGHLAASFLTTTRRLGDHPHGALGPIWRGPGPLPIVDAAERGSWLPLRLATASGRARS